MRVLVVNAGSSSLKLRVLADGDVVASEDLAAGPDGFDDEQVGAFVGKAPVDAVGHRVVHGGTRFTAPTVMTPDVVDALQELTDLAPLHQPKSLAGISAVSTALPDTPAVACFDTAFHATIPEEAHTYALPLEWRERWDVRRFGFHGLSHAYASRRAAELVTADLHEIRVVVCHLGAGASLCAVRAGQSVDTTMGFTPLEGLVMATRSGSVDPGLVLWLMEHAGLSEREVAEALEHRSGVLALAGTSDMREVLERDGAGDVAARLAVAVYTHRLAAGIASMTASLGGVDVLAFTGGVGENAPAIRAAAAERLRFLGVEVDIAANDAARSDAEITATGAPVRTVVVSAREDLEIERGVHAALGP